MCQSKAEGGRRCSAHAREALSKAITTGDITKIEKAQDEYNRTPEGIKSLRESGETVLAAKYEKEREMRAKASILAHNDDARFALYEALNDNASAFNERGGFSVDSLTVGETADGKAEVRVTVTKARGSGFGDNDDLRDSEGEYLSGLSEEELKDPALVTATLNGYHENFESNHAVEISEEVKERALQHLGSDAERYTDFDITVRSGVTEDDVRELIDEYAADKGEQD